MWVLNTFTYQLVFVQDQSRTPYAILSHVWDRAGEQTFQEIQAIYSTARNSFPDAQSDTDPRVIDAIRGQLSAKIRCCCDYAKARGYIYLWIDSCCIDKTSSAELSEAINSMFAWYAQADVCYVFLADVTASENPEARDSSFRGSMWFQRGWTLQELLVPARNVFLSKDWRMIGTKTRLVHVVEDVTGIPADILLQTRQLHTVSVAQRMAWASGRSTTRIEDEAYCLMGIFGVQLPVIYGEGPQAFVRLQEEVMRRIPDHSILAWGVGKDPCRVPPFGIEWPSPSSISNDKLRASKSAYLLATSPRDFQDSATLSPIPLGEFGDIVGLTAASFPPLYTPSGYGVRIALPSCTLLYPKKVPLQPTIKVELMILPCRDSYGRLPALLLSAGVANAQHLVGGFEFSEPDFVPIGIVMREERKAIFYDGAASFLPYSKSYPRIVLLCPSTLKDPKLIVSLSVREACIPHQRMAAVSQVAILRRPQPRPARDMFTGYLPSIILPCWTLEHLRKLGFDDVNLAMKDGEMVPIALKNASSHGTGDYRFYDFRLKHATREAITVAVFTCPASSSRIRHGGLHANVAWGSERDNGTQYMVQERGSDFKGKRAPPVLSRTCVREHVDAWTNARKRFDSGPRGAAAVTLHFSDWDSTDHADEYGEQPYGSSTARCLALDIHVDLPPIEPDDGSSSVPQPSKSPVAEASTSNSVV